MIYGMDADLWPSLALSCDALVEKRMQAESEVRG